MILLEIEREIEKKIDKEGRIDKSFFQEWEEDWKEFLIESSFREVTKCSLSLIK